MKIEVYTQSGRPADVSLHEQYTTEWRSLYDKASERAMGDMLKMQRFLSFYNHMQQKKYNTNNMVEFPKTAKQLAQLIKKYEAPITFALRADTQKLIAIVNDSEPT